MLNIVIFGKEFSYCKSLMKNLNMLNNRLKIIAICNSQKELLEALKIFSVDVILIDVENIDLHKVLNKIIVNQNKQFIILISNYCFSQEELAKTDKYRYIIGKRKYKEINDVLDELSLQTIQKQCNDTLEHRKTIIEKIQKELTYLNVKHSYNGVKYLIEAIYMLYQLDSFEKFNLEKDIYSIIAKKYNKPIDTIKSDINYSIRILYLECEEEKLADYLGEYNFDRASTKKLILAVLRKIKNIDTEMSEIC